MFPHMDLIQFARLPLKVYLWNGIMIMITNDDPCDVTLRKRIWDQMMIHVSVHPMRVSK